VKARLLALEISRGQLGIEETANDNRGPRVEEYQRAGSFPYVGSPYCADGFDWALKQALGYSRVKKNGVYILVAPKGIKAPCASASCFLWEVYAEQHGWIVKGHGLKGDCMILDSPKRGTHFTQIDNYLKLVGGLLYVNTIEYNTTPAGALSTSKHGREGVYRKRRIVRRSSATIFRVPGDAKAVSPFAKAALARLKPKPKKKPKPKPKPKFAYAVYATVDGRQIRVFKGTWAKAICYLGLAKSKTPAGKVDIRKEPK
jgi:hypothetical protein